MRIRVKAMSIEDAVAQFIRKKIEFEEEARDSNSESAAVCDQDLETSQQSSTESVKED